MAILADHPALLPVAEEEGARSLLTDARLRDMYSAAHAGRPIAEAVPSELSDIVVREVLSGKAKSLSDPARTLIDALRVLRSERLQGRALDLDRRIKDAERRGDLALARELALEKVRTHSEADRLRRPRGNQ